MFYVLNRYYSELLSGRVKNREKLFEDVYGEVSGVDIRGFVDAYVYGTKPLPITIVDGEIVVGDF